MNSRLRKLVQPAGLGLLGAALLVTSIQAAPSTHRIMAKQVGQDNGDGTTTADVLGGGLLQGTTFGSFIPDFSNFPPIIGLTGSVTFSTNNGTLTVCVTGFLDGSTGVFEASGPVCGSTGKLAGATGFISFVGLEDLSTGAFISDTTGEITVDLDKD
jgi:hypothetical protein